MEGLGPDADPRFVRLAGSIDAEPVRAALRSLADGEDAAAHAAQETLAAAADPSVVAALLARVADTDASLDALRALAAFPCGTVSRWSRAVRRAAKSPDTDIRFWASLVLAKSGAGRPFRRVVAALDHDDGIPRFMWGDPWSAYNAVAAAKPVPPRVAAWLAGTLNDDDLTRDQRIVAGALTGLVDAEGTPRE